jgi:hypothetical protein
MEVILFLLKLLGSTFSLVIFFSICFFYTSYISPSIESDSISTFLFFVILFFSQIILTPICAKLFINDDIDFLNKFLMSIGALSAILVITIISINNMST